MLQTTSAKTTQQSAKLTIKINSPQVESKQCPRTPAFSRKGGQQRRDKRMQSLKSSEERSVDKSLKYTKFIPNEWKDDVSEIHSEVQAIRIHTSNLCDSRETVPNRGKSGSKSHSKQQFLYPTIASPRPKSPGRKVFQQFVSGTDSIRKSRINHKNDQHYIYWKNKAYEYLESNIKLMEQVRKLVRENENLKNVITQLQDNIKNKTSVTDDKVYSEKAFSTEIRNISSIYIGKIENMEKQLKRKEIAIATYQLKVKELNIRLAGDNERIKLISKLQQDIEAMKAQTYYHKVDSLRLESNNYVSTSILLSD